MHQARLFMKLKRLRDSQVRFLLLPGKRGAWRAKHLHVPQVDGSRGALHAPFGALVTDGALLVVYLKGARCALGNGGRHGRPRGHRPRGGQKPAFRSARGVRAKE